MSKNSSVFNNEIKSYEPIRQLIRQLFKYGDQTTKELIDSKKYGKTTYFYSQIYRLENYLPKDRLTTTTIKENGVKKKTLSIAYDPVSYPINALAATFQESTYDAKDILFYFTFLQLFSEDADDNGLDAAYAYRFSSSKSDDTLPNYFYHLLNQHKDFLYRKGQLKTDRDELENHPFTENTLRQYIHDSGLITPVMVSSVGDTDDLEDIDPESTAYKTGKNQQYYKFTNDIFDVSDEFDIKDRILNQLLDFIRFTYNHADIAIPGWQLSKTLSEYLFSLALEREDPDERPCFEFDDVNALNIVDNDIFWTLITAIHNNSIIKINYLPQPDNQTPDNPGPISYTLLPIKVIAERQYGRQYLFAYNYQEDKYRIYRLDRISEIENIKKGDLPKETSDNKYNETFRYAWNIDATGEKRDVLLHFRGPKERQDQLINYLKSQRLQGTVSNQTDTGFDYTITVSNETEIKPWIRSLKADVTVDPVTNPLLHSQLKSEIEEILKRYEPV